MKTLLATIALFFATALAAPAGALDTRGIPANASGIVHLDAETVEKSAFATLAFGQIVASVAPALQTPERYETLKKEIGFDPAKDITDITIGLLANKNQKNPLRGILVVRGRFTAKTLLDAPFVKNAKTLKIGEHTFVDASTLEGLNTFGRNEKILMGPVGDGVLLIADESVLNAALEALSDAKKSYTPTPDFTKFAAQVGKPFLTVWLDNKVFPETPPPAPEQGKQPDAPSSTGKMPSFWFVLGSHDANIRARFSGDYATAEDAQKSKASFQTLLALLGIQKMNITGNDGSPDIVKADRFVRINRLYDAIKTSGDGRNFVVSVDYPQTDALWLLKNQ